VPCFLYILQSDKTGKYYVGIAADIDDRVLRHNQNRTHATKGRGPWLLVYFEEHSSRTNAEAREREIKSWKSAKLIRKLISPDVK